MVDKKILAELEKTKKAYHKKYASVSKKKDKALTEAGNQYVRGFWEGSYIAMDIAVDMVKRIMRQAGKLD